MLSRCIVGYDRNTERVAFEAPAHTIPIVFPAEDQEGLLCYPLTFEMAREAGAESPGLDYFLEAYSGGDPGFLYRTRPESDTLCRLQRRGCARGTHHLPPTRSQITVMRWLRIWWPVAT